MLTIGLSLDQPQPPDRRDRLIETGLELENGSRGLVLLGEESNTTIEAER